MPTKREEEEAAKRQEVAAPPGGAAEPPPQGEARAGSTPSAGWYPDPRDPSRDRYWDGAKWAGQTRKRQGKGFVAAYRRLPIWAQIGIPVLAVLVVIAAVAGDGESGDSDQSGERTTEQIASEQPETAQGNGEAQPTSGSEAETPAAVPSGRQEINSILDEEFGGKLIRSQVTKAADSWIVMAVFRQEEAGLTSGTTHLEIEIEMEDAYYALFTAPGLTVKEAELEAEIPLIDKYGSESYGTGWITDMSGATGRKINWDDRELLDFEELWVTEYKHPDL
jgi:uncharacterized protein DUF2510